MLSFIFFFLFQLTMESLVTSLSVLAGGKDRVQVRTLFRALTTLGSSSQKAKPAAAGAFAAAGAGRRSPSIPPAPGSGLCFGEVFAPGWRGLGAEEAHELMDAFNLPAQVLASRYGASSMAKSEESMVVEFAAACLSGVCDDRPDKQPALDRRNRDKNNGFLGLCRRCKLCPPPRDPREAEGGAEEGEADRAFSRHFDSPPASSERGAAAVSPQPVSAEAGAEAMLGAAEAEDFAEGEVAPAAKGPPGGGGPGASSAAGLSSGSPKTIDPSTKGPPT